MNLTDRAREMAERHILADLAKVGSREYAKISDRLMDVFDPMVLRGHITISRGNVQIVEITAAGRDAVK